MSPGPSPGDRGFRSPSRLPTRRRSPSRSCSRSPVPRHDRRPSYTPSRSPSRSRSPRRSLSRSVSPRNGGRDRSLSPRSPDERGGRSPRRGSSRRESAKIVVERLTKNVNEAHIQEIFGAYGDIQSIDLPMNQQFRINRGTAYIVYYDSLDAEAAVAHMHESQLDGAVLGVSIVLPPTAFSRSPPPARNRGKGNFNGPPPGGRRGRSPMGGRFRSPLPPPRGGRPFRRGGPDRHDVYRPGSRARSFSRSPSPRRSRSISDRSRSPSRTPRFRKLSRSASYDSYSSRSRSPARRPPPRARSFSRSPSPARKRTSYRGSPPPRRRDSAYDNGPPRGRDRMMSRSRSRSRSMERTNRIRPFGRAR